ncbi:hypothetical protein BDV28DRAFT_157174 [Aspergillus coremiiformis]|uniref:Uncharacterized protein n=1 Tax=Aspergillus coremiiformis TaxID=138285 RepID=A0A5N6Z6D0_9EURO|nr:hypothetical protein BDV28DRAFT_157174 [Aspergillus coremiiformis]
MARGLISPSSTTGQRSRKKKTAVTIESIAPGRAPVGVYHPTPSATPPFHHVESRTENREQTATPSSSEWPRPASNCDSLHSDTSRQRDAVYELRNLDELPSSQAVSLSELCIRGSSRNKGSKSWKPLRLETIENSTGKDSPGSTAFFEIGQNKPRSRMSALHRAHSGECNLNKHGREASISSHLNPQPYKYGPEEQGEEATWQENANTIHYQENPLNYSHNYGVSYPYSHSQRRSCISESPFLRSDGYHNSGHLPWPTDLHSTSSELSFIEAPQPSLYSQDFVTESSIMADSSLNIYSASFDRPDNQSPYEMPVHYDQSDSHGGFSSLRSSLPEPQRGFRDFSPMPWDPSLNVASECVSSPEPNTHAVECQSQTSVFSRSQSSNEATAPRISPADILVSDGKSPHGSTKRHTIEEKLALLTKGVWMEISADELATKQTALPEPSVASNAAHAQEESSRGLIFGSSGKSTTTDPTDSGEVAIGAPCPSTMAKQSQLSLGHSWCDLTERWKGFSGIGLPGYLNLATSKRIRPPPGLSEPVAQSSTAWPSIFRNDPLVTQRRLDEANGWFHKDARGKDQLREQVRDIAQNYAERIERLGGATHASQESAAAKETSLLLGNVIVNLHSYVSENSLRDAAGFADFGDVKSCYCEPSLGGRRSYFDRDPSVEHWRLPLGRALSTMSTKSESSFSPPHTKIH